MSALSFSIDPSVTEMVWPQKHTPVLCRHQSVLVSSPCSCWLCSFVQVLRSVEYFVSGEIPGCACPRENDPEVQPSCYSFAVQHSRVRTSHPHSKVSSSARTDWAGLLSSDSGFSCFPFMTLIALSTWKADGSVCMINCRTLLSIWRASFWPVLPSEQGLVDELCLDSSQMLFCFIIPVIGVEHQMFDAIISSVSASFTQFIQMHPIFPSRTTAHCLVTQR